MFGKKDFESMSPARLYSEDSVDKVLAILTIMANPEKYKTQLDKITDKLQENQNILDKMALSKDLDKQYKETQDLLKEAKQAKQEADAFRTSAEKFKQEVLTKAQNQAEEIKQSAAKYASRVKEESQKLSGLKELQESYTKKAENAHQRAKRERDKVIALRKEYEEKLAKVNKVVESL